MTRCQDGCAARCRCSRPDARRRGIVVAAASAAAAQKKSKNNSGFDTVRDAAQRHPGRRSSRPLHRHGMDQRRPLLRIGRRNHPCRRCGGSVSQPDRVHRQPARDSEMHADRVSARPPARSTLRSARFRSPTSGSSGSSSRSTTWRRSPDQAGLLGFIAPLISAPVFLELTSRAPTATTGSTTVSTPQIKLGIQLRSKRTSGACPADPKHNKHRFITPLTGLGACFDFQNGCPPGRPERKRNLREIDDSGKPFLQNPTTCGVPLIGAGGRRILRRLRSQRRNRRLPGTTGCQQLSFSPSVLAKPTTDRSDTASGLDLTIKVPQSQSGETPASSELRTSLVTLPEGFTINPNAADGKVACPDIATASARCSKRTARSSRRSGAWSLDVAALPGPIPGAIYLAEPKPGEPYRVILAADGFATHVKLLGLAAPGSRRPGQVTLAFEDLPQSPLQEFDLHIFGSERGLFASPPKCGHITGRDRNSCPGTTSCSTRHPTGFMDFTGGPNGSGCPGGTRPFAPTHPDRRRQQHRRRPQPVQHHASPATTATRT